MEPWLNLLGYVASLIILISLFMQSIKRLRVVNLAGAIIFCVYGYLIGAYPVMILNVAVIIVNLYYLREMAKITDYFTLLVVNNNDYYLRKFLSFHEKNIAKAMAFDRTLLDSSKNCFFVLRNMIPAGLLIVHHQDEETLSITLDYATPSYQDFKTGKFVFLSVNARFKQQGYQRFQATASTPQHARYLEKMGFVLHDEIGSNTYTKEI